MRKYHYSPLDEKVMESVHNTDPMLLRNFNKVLLWLWQNCPKLNGTFYCPQNEHQVYWVRLVVENGRPFLEVGVKGHWHFKRALSRTVTAVSDNSCTTKAYVTQFFRNEDLERFLKDWPRMKVEIINEYTAQRAVYSPDFIP